MAAAGAALIALAAGGWITSASQGAPQSGSAAGGVGSLSPSTTTQSTLTGLPGVEGFAPFQEASQLLGSVGLFGASVAVSADGRTAIVGAPREGGGAGSARVFVLTPSGWQEQAQLGPSEGGEGAAVPCTEGEECRLGVSVAISADGNTVIAGSPREEDLKGAVRAFVRTGTTWSQLGPELTGESSRGRALFGRSVAISADGQTALIGAPGSATATILHRSGSGWTQEGATIASPDKPHAGGFGSTVALSGDGSVAFIGAPGVESRSGAVWAFVREGNDWRQQGEALTGGSEATAGAHFGSGLALSFDGSTALVGADGDSEGAGAAWALVRSGATWIHQGPKLTASGELGAAHFGQSVALSASGDSALVGGPADNDRRGAAWTLTRADSKWSQQAKIPTPDLSGASRFGTSVSLSADGLTALIGAPYEHKLPGSAWALWTPASPTVQTVEPSEGPSSGGTDVTITGSGFLPGASVRIGTAAASV
ncbi:MAG: IPT/TIG domain-containing protein, partial [Solirubrobacteraceae bacterium]